MEYLLHSFFYADQASDKLFWLHTNTQGNATRPWNIYSADVNHVYADWIQTSSQAKDGWSNPIGCSLPYLTARLADFALQDARRDHDDVAAEYEVTVKQVLNPGILWRILQDFDTESLNHTSDGKRFLRFLAETSI